MKNKDYVAFVPSLGAGFSKIFHRVVFQRYFWALDIWIITSDEAYKYL